MVYSCAVGEEEVRKNPDINTLTPALELQQLAANILFQQLAEYRQQLGLPPASSEEDRTTIAKLEISGRVFFGINASSNPNRRKITLTVNPISRTHAEADALQQAFDAGLKGGRARLIVDRDLCRACGQNGGVKGMARQLNLEEIEVISPSGRQIITLK
ncbi:deaminase [Nostoc sp.]|uniref:deaminase n=1 Tax=Nostoc sp. TaxID=1180 RepID=UPI002FFCD4B5